ncbi:TylF/MycF/NovP-related O-methyltransferase [Luteimicrobium sp. DT211]|uniref:TylF/MycF/NovP-related O-methyltransferase n=1 Tax=Luteimicrobium sp. DT211 TaxID=3393412 RepID=UPI003CFB4BE6
MNAALRKKNAALTAKLGAGEDVAAELAKEREVTARLRRRIHRLESEGAVATLPEGLAATVARVRAEHLTLLQPTPLAELGHAMLDAELRGLEGLVIECGTARGGSAIVLASAKAPERRMMVYDVFGMIPPPTDRDGEDVHARYRTIVDGHAQGVAGETYYGYRDSLYDEVTASFSRLGVTVEEAHVSLVKGLFQDTIEGDEPVALAHLDGDWYESTRTCLERIGPRVVPGGRLVIDDYFSWSGCRDAVDEFVAANPGFRRELHSRLHLVRD